MKHFIKFIVSVIVLSVSTACSADTDYTKLYKQVKPSVVRVEIMTPEFLAPRLSGTGFVYDNDTIITAKHVVPEERDAVYLIKIGKSEYKIKKIWRGPDHCDTAAIDVEGPIKEAPLVLAEKNPEIGAPVFTVGYPLDEPLVLSVGYVSYDLSGVTKLDETGLIAYNLFTYPGNSGGPVMDSTGKVVGIVLGGKRETNINWATSVETIRAFIAKCK